MELIIISKNLLDNNNKKHQGNNQIINIYKNV